MRNYPKDSKHRTKVNDSFSDFIDLLLGVPQDSILDLLSFNIFLCDLSFADDTTPYSNSKNVATVFENIKTKGKEVFNWSSMNYLKANSDKSQLSLTSKGESNSSKMLLGVLINNKPTFNEHVCKLCKRAINYMLWLRFQKI